MTTKRKPATALPFKDGPLFGHDQNRALFWTDTSKPGKWQRRVDAEYKGAFIEQDAAYIAHAANAYPQLVEALRRQCAGGWQRADGQALAIAMAQDLLRYLGEDA